MEKQNKISLLLEFVSRITKHPFLTSAAVCLLSTFITTGTEFSPLAFIIPALTMAVFGVYSALFISEKAPEKSRVSLIGVLCFAVGIFSPIFGYFISQSQRPYLTILMTGIISVIAAGLYMFFSRNLNTGRFVMLMLALGFLLRLAYIMNNTVRYHQHDAGSAEELDGHMGYIAYLSYNLHLPDFDVRNVYQFYHPPLHHIIAAMWVRIQNLLGIPFDNIWENVQILTLFYSCCCMILCYKIFRKLSLDGTGLCSAMAIICFNPTLFILSGSVNNDMLCLTFMLAAVYNTLYWYKSRNFGRIICIAVSVGCAMMSKLSGWMVAPAIAFIFIYVFFTELRSYKKYIPQYAAFLPVCAALGLWWGIRNYALYQVPITYVMELSERSEQYIGDIPVMKRLFDFNFTQFENVGDQFMMYDGAYNEYNPLIALFKTSAFDELYTVHFYKAVAGWDKFLFFSVLAVGMIAFFAMVFVMIFDKKTSGVHKIFLGLIYGVILISYYIFCIKFPQVCTENIRYAVPLIVIGAYFFGRTVQILLNTEKNGLKIAGKITGTALCSITVIYSISSVIFYYITFMG